MQLKQLVLPALALSGSALGSPTPAKRADEKVGYLSVYWTTDDESVYFALSDNDDRCFPNSGYQGCSRHEYYCGTGQ